MAKAARKTTRKTAKKTSANSLIDKAQAALAKAQKEVDTQVKKVKDAKKKTLAARDKLTKNATDAAEKALLSYKNIYWVAGGVAKAGGIVPLGHCFAHVRQAYLIGEAREKFAETLGVHGVECTHFESLAEATKQAYKDACASGEASVVLLSPACASFDQFPNFETRGDAFIDTYEAIKNGGSHAASA